MNVYVVEIVPPARRRRRRRSRSSPGAPRRRRPTRTDAHRRASWCATSSPVPTRDWPRRTCPGSSAPSRRADARRGRQAPDGHYDLVHSHYWLSGQVGWLFAERWGVPLVHTMHTMAKVKNARARRRRRPRAARPGDRRAAGRATPPTASSPTRTRRPPTSSSCYGADPDRVAAVPPGVDLGLFRPGDRGAARARLGLPARADVLLFVGPDPAAEGARTSSCAAAARLRGATRGPGARRLVVAVLGGPSRLAASPGPTAAARTRPGARRPGSDVLLTHPPVAAGRCSPTGTARRTSSPCPRTASPSVWSPWRPRPAAPRWSPPTWAGCARPSRRGVGRARRRARPAGVGAWRSTRLLADPPPRADLGAGGRRSTPPASAGTVTAAAVLTAVRPRRGPTFAPPVDGRGAAPSRAPAGSLRRADEPVAAPG